MPLSTLIPTAAQTGVVVSPSLAVPAGKTEARIVLADGLFTDPATSISFAIEQSPDGGASWSTLAQAGSPGGSGGAKNGASRELSAALNPAHYPTHVRARLTIGSTVTVGVSGEVR
jgi:hypothetical protein